jgi:hypothetical protein
MSRLAHPILDFSQFPVLLHSRILVVLFKERVPATGALAPKAFWQGFLPVRAVVVASMLRLTAIPFSALRAEPTSSNLQKMTS